MGKGGKCLRWAHCAHYYQWLSTFRTTSQFLLRGPRCLHQNRSFSLKQTNKQASVLGNKLEGKTHWLCTKYEGQDGPSSRTASARPVLDHLSWWMLFHKLDGVSGTFSPAQVKNNVALTCSELIPLIPHWPRCPSWKNCLLLSHHLPFDSLGSRLWTPGPIRQLSKCTRL